jgi:hypothetical protein
MKKLFLLFAGAALVCSTYAITNKTITIKKAAKPVTVDGTVDDNDPWIVADEIVMAANDPTETGTGMTAKFELMYDDNNLYYLVDAKDATMGDTAYTIAPWNADCVEFNMSMCWDKNYAKDSGWIIGPGCYQFRKLEGFVGKDPKAWSGTFNFGADNTSQAGWLADPKFLVAEEDAGDGYVQEWQIPWDSLQRNIPDSIKWDGTAIRAEPQVSDNVAGTQVQRRWWNATTNEQWHNSQQQGLVVLATPVGAGVKNITDEGLNVYPTLVIDMLKISKTANYRVTNLLGQKVAQGRGNQVNFSNLKSGVYFITLNDKYTTKLVKR